MRTKHTYYLSAFLILLATINLKRQCPQIKHHVTRTARLTKWGVGFFGFLIFNPEANLRNLRIELLFIR